MSGEYWNAETQQWVTDTGRTAEEQRRYEAAYEAAGDGFKTWAAKPHPAPPPAEELPSHTAVSAQFPVVLPRGDRGVWARNTAAGMLAQVVAPDAPDEAAREMAKARAFCDDWEYRYNRRPSMAEARLATGRRSDGVVISGTAEQVGKVFAQAGLPFGVISRTEALPPPGDAAVRRSVA